MKKSLFLIISVGFIVLLAGCVKEKPAELKFKNDVVTIENYFVSNVAPYEKGKTGSGGQTSIQFEIHNNGDQKIPYLEVEFFDIPGFKIVEKISKSIIVSSEITTISKSLSCGNISTKVDNKCIFRDANALEPLDVRDITIQLESIEDVSSPTPHTVSFSVRYVYQGSREISIPIIDGETRKQPLTKFRQGNPSTGPILIEIDPSIEREVSVGGKTIKEYWGIGGNSPLPFGTKFKFKHVGTVSGKVTDVIIPTSSIRLDANGLEKGTPCDDFCKKSDGDCPDKFAKADKTIVEAKILSENKYLVNLGENYYQLNFPDADYYSTKPFLVPFDTLICTFKPSLNQPEYSGTISAYFAYKYEFIKSQDFVVQPLPEAG